MAAPLVLAGLACLVLGLSLRSSEVAPADGRLQVWGLFIALGVVAWVGAGVSAALNEPGASGGRMGEKKERAIPPARSSSSQPDASEENDVVLSPAGIVVRRSAAPDVDGPPPAVRRRALRRTEGEGVAPEAGTDDAPIPAAPPIRDPADRAVDDWTPAEAIAELDQLQMDLERLRRSRRAPTA